MIFENQFKTKVDGRMWQMLLNILSALVFIFPCINVFGQTGSTSRDNIPAVTVCEVLHNRISYNSKSIIVIGRIESSFEGTWLTEDCEEKISTDGVLWEGSISWTVWGSSSPPPKLPADYDWDDTVLLDKLKSLKHYTQFHPPGTYAAVFGRFKTKILSEYFRDASGRLRGLGFGHLGSSLAQLDSESDGSHELKEKDPGLIPANNDSLDRVTSVRTLIE
jgi:hypothetical protein